MLTNGLLDGLRGSLWHHYRAERRGAMSAETARAYLRASCQIEPVWQRLDDEIARRCGEGDPPWAASRPFAVPLACIRAARMHQIVVRHLLTSGDTAHLPRVTSEQACAFGYQIQPNVRRAAALLEQSGDDGGAPLPLRLSPRADVGVDVVPVSHARGLLESARECHEWTSGLVAAWHIAVNRWSGTVPDDVRAHGQALDAQLAQAASALCFATDMLGEPERRVRAALLQRHALDSLWQALRDMFLLNQAIALPDLLAAGSDPNRAVR